MYQKIDKMVKDLEKRGCTQDTIKNKVWILKNFSKHYNKPPELLGEQQIVDYLDYCLNQKKLFRGTVNTINSSLKFFYVVTLERNLSDLRIPRLRYDKRLPLYLTREEVKNLKHKALLSTIYSAGLRVSEAINLRVSDILSKEMKIRVRCGKRNKERYTLLSKKNLLLLREYWKEFSNKDYSPDDYLFTSRQTGAALTNRGVECAMEKAIKRAGITKKATPHTLRHSFATHLMNDGVDLVTIQTLLGHSNIKSTSRYLHIQDYQILKILSPLDRL